MGLRTTCAALSAFLCLIPQGAAAERLQFNRDVRPILAERCYACHGPDASKRKANLRLDQKDSALAERKGPHAERHRAVSPGDLKGSTLFARITAGDPSERMPPPKAGVELKPDEIALLQRWIEEGASYEGHWAYLAPREPPLPAVRDSAWVRNEVDRFVLARLARDGLAPSLEADSTTLLRRVTLDLTGLPPAPSEIDAFLADTASGAYERAVERLLVSARSGERLALEWLDAARYADTNGYHIDNGRDMTRWREWVIEAFNTNLPFDRFVVEQIAGDLLPNATLSQQIASGFHRNHMINFEGGAIPEEYHTAYLIDRVNTTGAVFLGMTLACSQCHDHKYDPMTQREFYQLYAFFNGIEENGLDGNRGNSVPLLKLPSAEQARRQAELSARITEAEGAKKPKDEVDRLRKSRDELDRTIPTTMVMKELSKPRETRMLLRGQYDKKGDRVEAGVPAFLPPLPAGAPRNRLGLARWLVDPSHPLTARVTVNRYWQMLFGTGLVKTAEDFGSQGEFPSHPELLDWLSARFMASGWDVRALLRLVVTSSTYRQSSRVTREHLERDPENRLLARGARFRLQAEFIRDQALAAAGLLDARIGGASVSPYQPSGLWEELMSRADGANWTAQSYTQSHGADLYRRGMYTFWKRTCPPPTLATFDAPDREVCTVRRARTNTPLQALILMNDPTYVEASRKLAERVIKAGTSPAERIDVAFRLLTARRPTASERDVLGALLDDHLRRFRDDGMAARKLLKIGEAPHDASLDAAELAAWTMVASAILNLDETVTRG